MLNNFFGIDISDLSLKIAKLDKTRGGLILTSYGRQDLPPNIIKKGEIQNETELIQLIQSAIAEAHGKPIKTKNCVVSLPETKAFIRVVQLPLMDEREIGEAIKWEAEANIPMNLDDIYLDWQVLSRGKTSQDILIGALPKILVDNHLNLLKKAGLSPVCFEIESVATARAVIKNNYSEKPTLIIDMGAERISLIIFYHSSIYFTASLLFGNNQMINAIVSSLSISHEKAKELKIKTGFENSKSNEAVFKAIEPVLKDLADGIAECCRASEEYVIPGTEKPIGHVSKIILCGGGANLAGLINFLYDKTGLPVELANPWVNILGPNLKTTPELPFEESLSYATALGLALYNPRYKL